MRLPILAVLVAAASSLLPRLASGQGLPVDIIPNFVGVGAGVTPQWMGAKDNIVGIVPGARVSFSDHRFFEAYGPIADVNVLDVPNWELGPMLSYRFGRKDVDDEVVNQLPAIGGGLEGGLFAGYHYIKTGGIPWRLRVGVSALTGIVGDATGTHVTPYVSFWLPLSHTVFMGLGGGGTWSSASFMHQRFGVTPEASEASGLPTFSADAGVRQLFGWPAILVRLSQHWFGGAGAFYQRLMGDAADSPIITQRGDRNQWTAGLGLGYAW